MLQNAVHRMILLCFRTLSRVAIFTWVFLIPSVIAQDPPQANIQSLPSSLLSAGSWTTFASSPTSNWSYDCAAFLQIGATTMRLSQRGGTLSNISGTVSVVANDALSGLIILSLSNMGGESRIVNITVVPRALGHASFARVNEKLISEFSPGRYLVMTAGNVSTQGMGGDCVAPTTLTSDVPQQPAVFSWKEIEIGSKESKVIMVKYEEEENESRPIETGTLLAMIGGLMLPNFLVFFIRLLCHRGTASAMTLIASLCLNAGHALLICVNFIGGGQDLWMGCYCLYGAWGLLQIIGGLAYKLCHCGNYTAICELCGTIVPAADLIGAIRENRCLAPKVMIIATASHEETRQVAHEYQLEDVPVYRTNQNGQTVIDHYRRDWVHVRTHYSPWGRVEEGGGRFHIQPWLVGNRLEASTERRVVNTWRGAEEYHYASWQDDGIPVRLPNTTAVRVTFVFTLVVDQYVDAEIEALRRHMSEEALRHDTLASTKVDTSYPGFIDDLEGCIDEKEVRRLKKTWANPLGYCLWLICWLTGYQAILECFISFAVVDFEVEMLKILNTTEDSRAGFRERDMLAGERAVDPDSVRKVMHREDRNTPLNPTESFTDGISLYG